MRRFSYLIVVFLLSLCASSCTTVKPYQRSYLNDPEMDPANSTAQKMEHDAQTIREGGTTPGGSKSSGGCGCN